MLHYFRIYRLLVSNAFTREMLFRANFFISTTATALGWLGSILFIELLYGYTDAIGGWSKGEVYLLCIIWSIVERVGAFAWGRIRDFSDQVRRGNLDVVLTKPVDAQLLATLSKPSITALTDLVAISCIYGAIFLFRVDVAVSWRALPLAILCILLALVIDYSIRVLLNTLNFWFIEVNNVNELWSGIFEIGFYPFTIFTRPIKILFLTFLPIGFMAGVPSLVLLGKNQSILIVLLIAVSVFFFLSARMLWLYAIKHYSSASS